MDNHPIPQDVTGFQFRLIGSMTVKQFAYIAVGGVGAVIIYYLPLFILLKIILIPAFILSGVALAFVPIEGRPIDIMAANFLKALFSPNQFLYHRSGGQLLLSTIHIEPHVLTQAATAQQTGATMAQRQVARKEQLSAYLTTIHENQAPDEKEAARLSALFGPSTGITADAPVATPITEPVAQAAPVPTTPTPEPQPAATPTTPVMSAAARETPSTPVTAEPTPSTADTETAVLIQKDTEKIAEEEALLKQVNEELIRAKSVEQTVAGTPPASEAHTKVTELEQKLQEIMSAKAQLEQELQSLKVSETPKIVTTPDVSTLPVSQPVTQQVTAEPAATPASTEATQVDAPATVATPPTPVAIPGGFPSLPDVPNIFLGVVRDSSGNVLPNILVEVTDKDGNPVRAFKTNQLGQFMSATPLKEGNYTVVFEDSKNQYKFDPSPLVVNNQILQPLEVAAHDLREELRKSLFA